MQTRRLPFVLLALLGALTGVGCAGRPPHRYFQPTADQIGPQPNSYGEVVVPRHGLIAVQGDDFAYGLARGRSRRVINGADQGQAAITISETLRRALRGVRVENRGFPGDTAAASVVRWAQAAPADLTILSFSYGDAAAHTDMDVFRRVVAEIIHADQARGGSVLAVLPPPSADPLRNGVEGDYRGALRDVAKAHGVEVFDAYDAEQRLKIPRFRTTAQSAAIYQGAAADMALYIKVVDATSPQTGQSGSGESPTVRASPASPS